MSGARPPRIPVGVVVERRKAQSQWIDFIWRPVAVLAGQPDAAPWTILAEDGETTRRSMPAQPTIELLPHARPRNYRDNLASGAPCSWVALRPTGVDPPYELFAVTADPSEGEALTEAGDRSRRGGADAGGRCARRLRRSSPSIMSSGRSSSASATAPIRKRLARRGPTRGRTTRNERATDNFLDALVARRKAAAQDAEARPAATPSDEPRTRADGAPKATDTANDAARAPAKRMSRNRAFDPRKLPSIEFDHGGNRHPRLSRAGRARGTCPCGASPRLGDRSRQIRDFVGLAENDWDFTAPAAMPGFGPLGDDRRTAPAGRAKLVAALSATAQAHAQRKRRRRRCRLERRRRIGRRCRRQIDTARCRKLRRTVDGDARTCRSEPRRLRRPCCTATDKMIASQHRSRKR